MQHYYQLSGHDNVKEIMAKFLTDRLHTPKPINAKNLNFQAGKSYVLVQSVKSIIFDSKLGSISNERSGNFKLHRGIHEFLNTYIFENITGFSKIICCSMLQHGLLKRYFFKNRSIF